MSLRERIDAALRAWAGLCCRHPWPVLLLSSLAVAMLVAGAARLRIDASTERFLKRTDPARVAYGEFREDFGYDEVVLLAIPADDVFDARFLERLARLHADLEEHLPYVEEITSLVNARNTYARDDELVVEDLLEGWEPGEPVPEGLAERALANPLYRNVLLSEDGRFTAILVELAGADHGGAAHADFLSGEDTERLATTLEEIVARHASPDFPVHVSGVQPVSHDIIVMLDHDMKVFTGGALLAIAVVLALLFRRASGVLLPLATVMLALAGTFGGMGWLGVPISPIGQILPSFLLAVGIGDAVHILALVFRALDHGIDRERALVHAVEHSGLAVIMTSLTTAACLGSFAFADLQPLIEFGLAASAGTLLALLLSLVWLPPVIALTPMRPRALPRHSHPDRSEAPHRHGLDRVLAALADGSTARPRLVLASWAVALGITVYGAAQLRFEHQIVDWLDAEHPGRVAAELVNREMRAGNTYQIIVEGRHPGAVHEPSFMHKLARMREFLEGFEAHGMRAGKASSIVDVLEETHQALTGEPRGTIPETRAGVAQELLLFEMSGSNDLDRIVDTDDRRTRITLTVPFADALDISRYFEEASVVLEEILAGEGEITVTGQAYLHGRTTDAMLSSTAKSYTIALATIAPLMMLLVGSVRRGLLSMVPNVTPIVMAMGLMHWIGIPLDMFTMLVGSVAIGVAVDDTIHFMHNFRRYHARTGDPRFAARETLLTAGRAMLVTSVVLACGFLVFVASSMNNVASFGIVTTIAVVFAFLADATLAPALLTWLDRGRPADQGVEKPT